MKDEALKKAQHALEGVLQVPEKISMMYILDVVRFIREALAQPQQEPVATLWQHGETGRTRITMPDDITDCDARWFKAADLYTSPPTSNQCKFPLCQNEDYQQALAEQIKQELYTGEPAQRKPLTDEEMEKIAAEYWLYPRKFVRAIESAHGIKE